MAAKLSRISGRQSAASAGHGVTPLTPKAGVLQRKACACGGSCPRCQGKPRLPAKLAVSRPGDTYEQEADRVADQVMRMPAGEVPGISRGQRSLQRKCAPCASGYDRCPGCAEGKEEELIQRKAGPSSEATDSSVPTSILQDIGPGQPLDTATRAFFEPRFAGDFSGVRIHTEAQAAAAARAVGGRAFTVGQDIVFDDGQYEPRTTEGRRLLGHELTHVVQQHAAGMFVLQRQEDDSAERQSGAGQPSPPPTFGELPPEPPCPAVKSTLGKIAPEKPCPFTNISIHGFEDFRIKFCRGSDVFKDPGDRLLLRERARGASSNANFFVHAYASREGNFDENVNLACHRANRVGRELLAAGVPGSQINIFRKDPTDEFAKGFTEQALEENRVVLVKVIGGTLELRERDRPESREEMLKFAEDARKAIQSQDYRLAADAYVSRWTCGRVPSLAGAVLRPTLVVSDQEPSDPNLPDRKLGVAKGFNTIELSQDIFQLAANPFECAVGRIADLAFHHLVKEQFPDNAQQHEGGMFVVELAGLSPCRDAQVDPWLRRRTKDPYRPFEERLEDCLQGNPPDPLESRRRAEEGRVIPQFEMEGGVAIRSGAVDWTVDAEANRAFMTTSFIPEQASATVTLRGQPSQFSQYEIGYMQTITKDETVVEYVGGHRRTQLLPVPVRDRGGPGAGVPPRAPWFDELGVGGADTAGNVQVSTLKFVGTEIRPLALSSGNIVDTVRRHVQVVNWLVARRKTAPLDRFETHFLDGSVIDFQQQADVLGARTRSATLKTTMSTEPAEETEQRVMQFSGPVAEELRPIEKEVLTEPPSAEKAGRITRLELMTIIRKIAASLDPNRLGLTHSLVNVKVFFNRVTGRIALHDEVAALPGKERVVRVSSPNVPQGPRVELAAAILERVRKKRFLPGEKDVVVQPERVAGESKLEHVEVTLHPDPELRLIDRPGVKAAMKEMWRRTQETIELSKRTGDKRDKRGFSLTVYGDRTGRLRPFKIERGKRGVFVKDQIQFEEECGGTAPDLANDTPLGTIHTHPIRTGPSDPPDRKAARNHEGCGMEFYMINPDLVMKFGPTIDDDKILGPREEFFKE